MPSRKVRFKTRNQSFKFSLFLFPGLVLVGLYEEPERPPNAVDYIKRYMGAPTGVDIEALRTENETLKVEKTQLENTIKDLNAKVNALI